MTELDAFLRTDYKAVDKHDEVRSVTGWLTGQARHAPIVMDAGSPYGILNERALMSRHLDPRAHLQNFTLATRALSADATTDFARERMAEFRAAYLPVADDHGKLAGYVRAVDLAREDGAAPATPQTARELAFAVTMLGGDATLGDALSAFGKEYVEHLPVLSKDGTLAGVLSRSHVLRTELHASNRGRKDAGGEKRALLDRPVTGVMDEAPSTLPASASREEVLDLIERAGYAVVTDARRRPMGIVTAETLFQAA